MKDSIRDEMNDEKKKVVSVVGSFISLQKRVLVRDCYEFVGSRIPTLEPIIYLSSESIRLKNSFTNSRWLIGLFFKIEQFYLQFFPNRQMSLLDKDIVWNRKTFSTFLNKLSTVDPHSSAFSDVRNWQFFVIFDIFKRKVLFRY